MNNQFSVVPQFGDISNKNSDYVQQGHAKQDYAPMRNTPQRSLFIQRLVTAVVLLFVYCILSSSVGQSVVGQPVHAQDEPNHIQGGQPTINIQVTKQVEWNGTIGAPPSALFNICLEGPSMLCQSVNANTTVTYLNLDAGTYTITEPDLGSEWAMDPITPIDGTTTFPQPLQQTVVNRYRPGRLQITKSINWGIATPTLQTFRICIQGPSYPNGNCRDFETASSQSKTWSKLLVGKYTITEVDPGSQWSVAGADRTVDVFPDQISRVTVTNSLRGTLGITKQVLPDNLPTSVSQIPFSICIDGPAHAPEPQKCVTLSDDGYMLLEDLTLGEYTLSENPDSAWEVSFEPSSMATVDGSSVNVVVKNLLKNASIELSVTASKELVDAGETVDYTFLVENTGELALKDIAITDSECTPVAVTSGAFNIGDKNQNSWLDVTGDDPWAFTCSQQIIADTTNTASATGVSSVNLTVTSNNATESVDVRPAIKLTKSVDPTFRLEPGGDFEYTLTIENNSTESVTIMSLTDTHALSAECTNLIGQQLPINGNVSCDYTLNFTEPGDYENEATVEVEANGVRVTDTAQAKAKVTNLVSQIEVLKTADRNSVPESGAMVEFTIQVTNKSSADVVTIEHLDDSIYGDVVVTGNGVETTSCAVPFVLQPAGQGNDVYVCQFTAFISGDIGEQHQNYLTATGVDDDQQVVRDSDSATITVVNEGSKLSVTMAPSVQKIEEPGGSVQFNVTIQNQSAADAIQLVELEDSAFGDITVTNAASSGSPVRETTCEKSISLAINEAYNCYFVASVSGTAGDRHENTLVVVGEDGDGQRTSGISVAEVEIIDVAASLSVTKMANKQSVAESGEDVLFTVTALNSSPIDTITIHSVTDDLYGDVGDNCTPSLPATLAPDSQMSCTFNQVVTGDFGQPHINTVTVEGFDDDNLPVSSQANAEISFTDVPSSMEVRKSADRTTASRAGDPVSFTVRVANQSAADQITLQSIIDSVYGDVANPNNSLLRSTDCAVSQVLDAGQFYECTFEAMVNGELGEEHVNVITVQGEDDDQNSIIGGDEVRILIADPLIQAIKRAELLNSSNDVANPGDRIRYTIEITNNGNAVADDVLLNDIPDQNTLLQTDTLGISQGTIEEGNREGDERILVQLGDLQPGGEATVTFDVLVKDPLEDSVARISNQGLITGENFPVLSTQNPDGTGTTDTLVRLTPVLKATKTAALAVDSNADGNYTPGDQILYEIVIHNSGTAAASNLKVTDVIDLNTTLINNSVGTTLGTIVSGNQAGESSVVVEIPNLAPGNDVTIRFVVRIKSPLSASITQIINQASVTAAQFSLLTDDPNVDGEQDPTIISLRRAVSLEASKTASLIDDQGETGSSPGDTLIYQVTIRNTGSVEAQGIVFDDTLDSNTSLIVGSVQSDQGVISQGNLQGDTSISINIGNISPNQEVTISFQARINTDIDPTVISIRNQGLVSGGGIADLLTDDPSIEGKSNPTETVLRPRALLRLTMTDIFFIDADKNGEVSIGDTLLYQLNLRNIGKISAREVFVESTLDANMTLIPESVTADLGNVESGNSPGDTAIRISIDSLPNGEDLAISFQTRVVRQPSSGLLINQAVAHYLDGVDVTAQQTVQSDDPTTEPLDDTTVTVMGQLPGGLIYLPLMR
ncbi:MAG: hypothetical protein AAF702_23125 [Chloroflexota bacterium]